MARSDPEPTSLLSLPTEDNNNKSVSSSQSKSLCQECQTESFRYQCPRCSFRSCSLACCVSHKKRTGCNGKRDRTKYLPVAHMDDSTISNDYHFLEDVLGALERAKRTAGRDSNSSSNNNNNHRNKKHKPNHNESLETNHEPHSLLQQIETITITTDKPPEPPSHYHQSTATLTNSKPSLPFNYWKQTSPKWRHFWQQAKLRGVHLLMMPAGMQRRKTNTSHVQNDVVHWKVDLRIHSSDPTLQPAIIVQTRKVPEGSIVRNDFKSLLPDHDHNNTQSYHWLIRKLPSPSNRPCYREIGTEETLQSILKGLTIIEYPTIEVVPENRRKEFPLAIQEVAHEATPTPLAS